MKSQLIQGDCLKVLPTLPKVKMVWADPPDNTNMKYVGYDDKISYIDYMTNLYSWIEAANDNANIAWFSFAHKYLPEILFHAKGLGDVRLLIWHYTFGQNRQTDFVSSYRPILRIMRPGATTYPDSVRIPSARQIKYNDKRAKSGGKLPDDVWEFPRVCGTFKERKKWHPCQHPKDLLKRMVLFSTKPGDTVIDMFAGSGNMFEVCKELDRNCIGIEVSKFYCDKIRETIL